MLSSTALSYANRSETCYPIRDGLPVLISGEAFNWPQDSLASMGKDEKLNKRRIVLDDLDQNKSVDQEEYRVKIKEYQLRLLNLQRALMESKA